MIRKMCKSKIIRARVTDKSLYYQGSLGIAQDILEAADIMKGEHILVANLSNGNRFETYAICEDKGKIVLNGAAARLGEIGDELIILSFGYYDKDEFKDYKMINIQLDEDNNIRV